MNCHKEIISYTGILGAYTKALPGLKPKYQIHFCTRMYRITGKRKYFVLMRKNLRSSIKKNLLLLRQFGTVDKKDIDCREDVRMTIRRNPVENRRIERREKYYKSCPEAKMCIRSLGILYRLFEFKLHKGKYRNELFAMQKKFKAFDWKRKMISREHLSANPVFFTNAIFYLKDLKIADYTAALDSFIRMDFSPQKMLKGERLFDQIYIYTHLIINESKFYQKYLTREQIKKYRWIFVFFDKNFDELSKRLNLDLILEILLCFKLARYKNISMERDVFLLLERYYDRKKEYLVADRLATIEDMEHANILLLMILNLPKNFYKIRQSLFA